MWERAKETPPPNTHDKHIGLSPAGDYGNVS